MFLKMPFSQKKIFLNVLQYYFLLDHIYAILMCIFVAVFAVPSRVPENELLLYSGGCRTQKTRNHQTHVPPTIIVLTFDTDVQPKMTIIILEKMITE